MANVFLALPTYDGRIVAKALLSIMGAIQPRAGAPQIHISIEQGSVLPFVFNVLWSRAVANRDKFDYFAMLHSDVVPARGWIDTLIAEMERLDADVVSVVIPEKNVSGQTSTAFDASPDDSINARPLTLREVFELPETFDIDDVKSYMSITTTSSLLVNTGCWIARLGRDWVKKVSFDFQNTINWPNGRNEAQLQALGEDWSFSRQLHDLGVHSVYATRKVQVEHYGAMVYNNITPWGFTHEEIMKASRVKS